MTKSNHLQRRASERGIDELTLGILNLFGERQDKRDGLTLAKRTSQELINIAQAIKNGKQFSANLV